MVDKISIKASAVPNTDRVKMNSTKLYLLYSIKSCASIFINHRALNKTGEKKPV